MSKNPKSLRAMPTITPNSAYRFSARLFHATAMFRATRDIRYYLEGVLFMPHPSGGAMIAATNGHQMCVAYDPTGTAPADRIVSVCPGLEAAAGRFHEGWVHMDEAPATCLTWRKPAPSVARRHCLTRKWPSKRHSGWLTPRLGPNVRANLPP